MTTDKNKMQISFFDIGVSIPDEPPTRIELQMRLIKKIDELALVVSDRNRLKPSVHHYEAIVARYRGVKTFTYRQNKFEALEARAIVRFLKEADSRIVNLEAEISDLKLALGFEG